MEERKKLYIPVNVIETRDIIAGIGARELSAIGGVSAVGIVIGVIINGITGNIVLCMITIAVIAVMTFTAVRRDNHNESLVDKIMQVYHYMQAQKQYEYVYNGLTVPWNTIPWDRDSGKGAE